MIRWAIKYVHPNRADYIDHMTVSYLRRDAWAKFAKDWEHVPALQKSMRRKGRVKAVRVEIREVVE